VNGCGTACGAAFVIAPGTWNFTAPLDPAQWIYAPTGQPATAVPKAWAFTLANINDIGFRYGGGFFFGHGAAVMDGTGTAEVQLTAFQVR